MTNTMINQTHHAIVLSSSIGSSTTAWVTTFTVGFGVGIAVGGLVSPVTISSKLNVSALRL